MRDLPWGTIVLITTAYWAALAAGSFRKPQSRRQPLDESANVEVVEMGEHHLKVTFEEPLITMRGVIVVFGIPILVLGLFLAGRALR